MKKFMFIVFLAVTMVPASFSQEFLFQKTYPPPPPGYCHRPNYNNLGYQVITWSDQNIMILGRYTMGGDSCASTGDLVVTRFWKLTPAGDSIWTKDLDYSSAYPAYLPEFQPYSFCRTSDNCMVTAGDVEGGTLSLVDGFLVKTDSLGNYLWSREYSGNYLTHFYTVIETDDKGLLAGGDCGGPYGSGQTLYVVKTDSSGNVQWQRTYGGVLYPEVHSLVDNHDGTYTTMSWVEAASTQKDKFMLMNINATNGNQISSYMFGSPDKYQILAKGIQTMDHNYLMAGNESSYHLGQVCTIKSDKDGHVVWYKSFGDSLRNHHILDLTETCDSGCIVAGYVYLCHKTGTQVSCDTMLFYLSKLGKNGDLEWEKIWGDSTGFPNDLFGVTGYPDHSIVVTGNTSRSFYAARFDLPGSCWPVGISPKETSVARIMIYPNPVLDNAIVEVTGNPVPDNMTLTVYDLFGKTRSIMTLTGTTSRWPRGTLPAGIYFYRVSSPEGTLRAGKLILSD